MTEILAAKGADVNVQAKEDGMTPIHWAIRKNAIETVSVLAANNADLTVKASDGSPFIVEISYAYLADVVHDCPGHWNVDMQWQEGHVWPQDAVLDDLIALIRL